MLQIKKKLSTASLIIMMIFNPQSSKAVHLSQNGTGEVLIFPYYTVHNSLNTIYSITNTTPQPKVIKIAFKEGEIGLDVLSFNVYLSAYDVWTGVITAYESTFSGHEGEPSVLHLTSDTSCSPYLNESSGVLNQREFLPLSIDFIDINASNTSMERAREGFIEVIEMGVLTDQAADAVMHEQTGLPVDCGFFESEWNDNSWDTTELIKPSSGLMGSAAIVDVSEGVSFSFDAMALENFWGGEQGLHSSPGSFSPTLDAAHSESAKLMPDGNLAVTNWGTGFEAVSAVLSQATLLNEFVVDPIIAAKTEWVVTFPTKQFHTAFITTAAIAPFNQIWNGQSSCDSFTMELRDRSEGVIEYPQECGILCPPDRGRLEFCQTSNVIEFVSMNPSLSGTGILNDEVIASFGGANYPGTFTSGWAALKLFQEHEIMTSIEGREVKGLPAVGFAVQRFTNANARPGMLAQYGSLFMHKSLSGLTTE